MLDYTFEHDGDRGRLVLTTQTGHRHEINCEKEPTQSFRAGGTGVVGAKSVPCRVLAIQPDRVTILIRNDIQLNVECFDAAGLKIGQRAFVTEKYSLDMESRKPGLFVSADKPERPDIQFINVDCLDGGGNVIKRYRVDAFTGEHVVM